MRNILIIMLLLVPLLQGCTDNGSADRSNRDAGTAVLKQEESETTPVHKAEDLYIDCVFDTGFYRFTSEALQKFDTNIRFSWNDKEKQAAALLSNGDSLILSIGGCNHFGYYATLYTDVAFNDTKQLIEKTRWIARNFFTNGFDEVYDQWIGEGRYEESESHDPGNLKMYSILRKDTGESNMIYEDFSFTRTQEGTMILVGGYIN
jgi:uncharacterized protein YceK